MTRPKRNLRPQKTQLKDQQTPYSLHKYLAEYDDLKALLAQFNMLYYVWITLHCTDFLEIILTNNHTLLPELAVITGIRLQEVLKHSIVHEECKKVTQASKSDNHAIREQLKPIPAFKLRQKDELTAEQSRPLGCASVLILSCFSIETMVCMPTTSAPAVCFPFSILYTDKGKLINEDWIQPGMLLKQSLALYVYMWARLCSLIRIYTPSGCVGDVFKDDGCALAYVSVTGRVMNQSGLSFTLTLCIER